MKFVDEVKIEIRSGKGGNGAVSFLRERYRPKGGPDGGDGGRGGSIVFVADENLSTLLDFRYTQHYRAEHGENGKGRQMYGRKGEDLIVRVPVGTIITDTQTKEVIADLDVHGAQVLGAQGGKGGRGNMHFATSTNQTPRVSEPGEPFELRRVQLTLKLLADIGLVGFPNAGKSTFVSRVSAAKPKIADYPFTTLTPNLGMVRIEDERSFVIADIPGLIPGASEGAGLGHRFLKHVERVSVLAFLVCVGPEEDRDPVSDYRALVAELEAYSPDLASKPRLILLTKADLPDTAEATDAVRALAEEEGAPFFVLSAVTGAGLDPVLYEMMRIVEQAAVRSKPADDG